MSEGLSFMLLGFLAAVVGLSGWLLPPRWSLLRLKRSFARLVPDRVNELLPRVVGSVLLVLGLGLMVAGWQMRDEAPRAPVAAAPASVPTPEPPVAEEATALPGSLEEKLFQAIETGATAEVGALLAEGADPNAFSGGEPPYHDYTPVLTAIEYGESHLVPLLLDAGADIDGRGWGGRTPLIYAIHAHENDLARLLIERGADVNAREPDEGLTPLTMALAYGDPSLVPELLAAGADPNILDNGGHNALAWVPEESVELRNRLIKAGAVEPRR